MTGYLTRKGMRFVAIVVAGGGAALLLWLATNVLNVPLPGVDTSPLDVQIIVAPQAFDWVSEAAERFNAEARRLNEAFFHYARAGRPHPPLDAVPETEKPVLYGLQRP